MNIGNIITQEHEQGITYKEINLYKSIGFGMFFGQSRICFKQKKKKHYSLPDHQLAGNLILVFIIYEKNKKSEFVTNFVGTKCLSNCK